MLIEHASRVAQVALACAMPLSVFWQLLGKNREGPPPYYPRHLILHCYFVSPRLGDFQAVFIGFAPTGLEIGALPVPLCRNGLRSSYCHDNLTTCALEFGTIGSTTGPSIRHLNMAKAADHFIEIFAHLFPISGRAQLGLNLYGGQSIRWNEARLRWRRGKG